MLAALTFDLSPHPAFFVLLVGLISYYLARYFQSPWRRLPPGPTGLPLLGNALQLGDKLWLTFGVFRKTFGDIVYLSAAGQPIVVISSKKIATDLLDRRASIYSDRPPSFVASELLSGGLALGLSRYNDTWRKLRKAGMEGFNKGAVHNYHGTQSAEALRLAAGIISQPDKWDAHFRRSVASAVMSIVYDAPIASESDPSVRQINDQAARVTRAASPGANFVQFFPWMRHIPRSLAKWKRDAQDWHERDSLVFEGLLNSVAKRLAKGETYPSYAATLIEDTGRHNLSEREQAWLAGTMFAAGADTTSGVMAWWLLAMVSYPETQKRAQAELDAVVGRSRVPTFADFEHLPYVRSMVKESLRWRSAFPIGAPHRCMEDDWYEGHFIPAGTTVIANVWEMNRDPEVYGVDAAEFNPARFLDAQGNMAPGLADTKEESHLSFGFGRRICMGRHVASNSLFIFYAMLLWSMNIEPETDENGRPVLLDVERVVQEGLVVRPEPFKCTFTPRFPEVRAIVEQEIELIGR